MNKDAEKNWIIFQLYILYISNCIFFILYIFQHFSNVLGISVWQKLGIVVIRHNFLRGLKSLNFSMTVQFSYMWHLVFFLISFKIIRKIFNTEKFIFLPFKFFKIFYSEFFKISFMFNFEKNIFFMTYIYCVVL